MSAARGRQGTRSWPVLLLTLPAFVAIWGGWVGLGGMTGFGVINLLPGMVDDGGWATVNTAVTLPIGLETYAAYALHAYTQARSPELKRFAGRSAIVALVLGGSGQLAYHVMESLGVSVAPWWITAIVATIPVAVLGAGTRLSSLIRIDAAEQPVTKKLEWSDVVDLAEGAVPGQDGSQPAPVRESDTRPVLVPRGSEQAPAVARGARAESRAPRSAPEQLENAVTQLLAGATVSVAAETHGVGRSTVQRYQKVKAALTLNPAAEIDCKAEKVNPELVERIRTALQERSRELIGAEL